MGFEFAETMAGHGRVGRASPGKQHPFRFEITAHADSTREHIADRAWRELRGIVHAPPIADAADAEGTITIRPLGQRIIRYELRSSADDGKRYEMVGQKDIRGRRPLDDVHDAAGRDPRRGPPAGRHLPDQVRPPQ